MNLIYTIMLNCFDNELQISYTGLRLFSSFESRVGLLMTPFSSDILTIIAFEA